MVYARLAVPCECAGRERYRWVANRGEEAVFTTTALFLGCISSDWIGGLCRVRVVLAIVAVIGSRLGLPRSEQLSRFDGCHRVPSHRPVSFISFSFCSTGPSCHLCIHSLLQRHLYRISSINAVAEAAEQAIFDSDAAVPFTRAYIIAELAIISHTFAYTR
jgi:hypothetical protein